MSWLIGKDPDAGKDWRQKEKGAPEDDMGGWHHQLSGQEFKQTSRDSEGQGSLECCSPRGHKESDTAERLNNKKEGLVIVTLWPIIPSAEIRPLWLWAQYSELMNSSSLVGGNRHCCWPWVRTGSLVFSGVLFAGSNSSDTDVLVSPLLNSLRRPLQSLELSLCNSVLSGTLVPCRF